MIQDDLHTSKQITSGKYQLEIPINIRFLMDQNQGGPFAYTREEARQYFRDVAAEARVPFIFLIILMRIVRAINGCNMYEDSNSNA